MASFTRLLSVWVLLMGAQTAFAAPEWFTISGDPADAQSDTIEVDPTSIMGVGDLKMVKLRVNRKSPVQDVHGQGFRSFESIAEFDCLRKSARHVRIQFFDAPLWQSPSNNIDYGNAADSPLIIQSIGQPSGERIIRAVCSAR